MASTPVSAARTAPVAARLDLWPHTTRLMPWLVAGFLATVCLIPIDNVTLSVSLPVDPKIDRVLLGGIGLLWVLAMWSAGEMRPRIPRLGAIGIAFWLWILTAFLSIATSLPTLVLNDEMQLVLKKFILLLAFVTFFLIVVSCVKPAEVRAFISFWMGLSAVLAIGAIYSYLTHSDPFRTITAQLLSGPFIVTQLSPGGFVTEVTGPASHGLALTTMLVLPMPFVLQRALDAETFGLRARYGGLLLLCATGSVVTGRKSAIVVPVVIALVMFAYRPRRMIKFWPIILVFIPLAQVLAPGALSTIAARADTKNSITSQSTRDRVDDWGGVAPDFIAHPLLGKGYGSNDPSTYRELDDQWLSTTLETGLIGAGSLLGLLVLSWAFAHRMSRRARSAEVRGQALAAAAALPAFIVSMALYDALGYVQTFYLIFFIIGLTVVMNAGELERESGPGEPEEQAA